MATSAAAEEEGFSFPITTTGSPPQFIESPPLWRSTSFTATVSPREKPESSKGKGVQDEEELNLCSFQEVKASSVDKIMSSYRDDDEDEDEEKMDMLWEDLNDEFSRIGCGINKAQIHSDVSSPGKEVKISCVKALKLSKANRNMFDGKKPSIIVFIKVLKKVFLMQNSHRTVKNHAW